MRHELGDTNLINMRVVAEGLLDILHIRTATREDDTSQELVIIFGRNLIPYVLDNLLEAAP